MSTATRDTPSSGVEQSMADFLLLALMLTKGRPGKIIQRDGSVVRKSNVTAVASDATEALPRERTVHEAEEAPLAQWVSLKEFIRKLSDLFKGEGHRESTVWHLKQRLTAGSLVDAADQPLSEYRNGKDVICVNGDGAAFADIVVFAHGPNDKAIVFLVQCTRCSASNVDAEVVQDDLKKMGRNSDPLAKKDPLASWRKAIGGTVEFRFVIVVYGDRPAAIPAEWKDTMEDVHFVACRAGDDFLVDVQPSGVDRRRSYAWTS